MKIFKVGSELFCTVAGIPDTADRLLQFPDRLSQDSALAAYMRSRETGKALSAEELRRMAEQLVQYTSLDETLRGTFRVGGFPQIATLASGKLNGAFMPLPTPSAVHSPLDGGHGQGNLITCKVMPNFFVNVMPPGAFHEEQVDMKGCRYRLDDGLVHDSSFANSILVLESSDNKFLFASSNKVQNTILQLGSKVDLNKLEVRNLVCDFAWSSVFLQGKKVTPRCTAGGVEWR